MGDDFVMQWKKTAFGFVLLVLLTCSVAVAFAQTTLMVQSKEAEAGAIVKVPMVLSGNTGICGATFQISYDGALKLSGIESGTALSSLTMTKPGDLSANPFNLVFDGMEADHNSGDIAYLTFVAPTVPGIYEIEVSYAEGDVVDGDLHPVGIALYSGSITVEGESQTAPMISVGKAYAKPGTSVSVPVVLTGNTGICGATIKISYDSSLVLTDISAGNALSSLTMTKPGDLTANPVNIVYDGMEADMTNGNIAMLTFTAPVTAGSYAIRISYADGDVVDGNLLPVELKLQNGSIAVKEESQAGPMISVGKAYAKPGASVSVPVVLTGNTGICGATIKISYDSSLVLTDVSAGSALSSLAMTKPGNLASNPVNIVYDGLEEDRTNGEIAYLTFTAPEKEGVYSISLSYDTGDIVDGDLQAVSLGVKAGSLSVCRTAIGVTVGNKSTWIAPYVPTTAGFVYVAFYTSDGRMLSVKKCNYDNVGIQAEVDTNAHEARILWLEGVLTPLCDIQKLQIKY